MTNKEVQKWFIYNSDKWYRDERGLFYLHSEEGVPPEIIESIKAKNNGILRSLKMCKIINSMN